MKKAASLLLLAFFCSLSHISAQVLSLTVDECVEMALNGSRDIQSARLKSAQYSDMSKSILANYFPSVSLQATDLWGTLSSDMTMDIAGTLSGFITDRITELAPFIAERQPAKWYLSTLPDRISGINPSLGFRLSNVFSSMIQIEQPIYAGGRIRYSYRMGQLGEKMAKLNEGLSEEEVIIRTCEAYSLAVKAEQTCVLAERYDSMITAVRQRTESAVSNGMASQADLMKVSSAKAGSELQLHRSVNARKMAGMNLCQIIGLPLTTVIDVTPIDSSTELPQEDYSTMEGARRKEYDILETKTDIARMKVDLERANYLPQAGLRLSAGYLNGMKMMGSRLFDNELHTMVMLNVSIPLFHAGEGIHKVRAAEAEYQQAVLEKAGLYDMLQMDMQQCRNELDEASLEVTLSERVFSEAEERLRICRRSFESGLTDVTAMLEAETEWQKACAALIDARHKLVLANLKWQKATGTLYK